MRRECHPDTPWLIRLNGPQCYPSSSIFTASPSPLQAKARATGNPRTQTICSPLEHHWPTRAAAPAGMCFSENSRFSFSSDLLCTGQKRSPGRQLRTVNSGPSSSALSRLSGGFLLRELLRHRDASHRQPNLRDVHLAGNRQGVLVTGEWRFRLRGSQFQAPTLAYCQPSAGKLRLRQLAEGAAQQLLDMFEVAALSASAFSSKSLASRAALRKELADRQAQRAKSLGSSSDGFSREDALPHAPQVRDRDLQFPLHQRLPVLLFCARQLRRVAQHLPDVRVVLALQQRQQFVSHSIARETMVKVALVLAPSLAESGEVLFDFLARHSQQGANDAARLRRSARRDSAVRLAASAD